MQLFIDNVEVLAEYPEELYPNLNYRSVDTYNPSAIKSNYSKTIKLPDCAANNKLFAVPRERYNWILYKNGHIIEQGYCTLDSITETYKSKYYNITLYGQLGDFFYNLKGDDENPKTLADLTYGWTNESTATYTWSVSNIKTGWDDDDTDPTSIHHTLKAIPCVNPESKNFDNKKTIVYEGSTQSGYSSAHLFPTTSPSGAEAECKTINNVDYLLVESDETTAFQKQDFRIEQMPVGVRYKDIINACCNPDNNGGYNVNLDPAFFNNNNPYWNNTYVVRRTPAQDFDYDRGTHTYNGWSIPNFFVSPAFSTTRTMTAASDDIFTATPEAGSQINTILNTDKELLTSRVKLHITPYIQIDSRIQFESDSTVTELYLQAAQYATFTGTLSYTDANGNSRTAVSSKMIGNAGSYFKVATREGSSKLFAMDPFDLEFITAQGDMNNIKLQITMGAPAKYYYKYYKSGVHAWFYGPIDNTSGGVAYFNSLYFDDPRTGAIAGFLGTMDVSYVATSTITSPVYDKKNLLGSSKTPFDYLTAYTKMFNLRYYMHEDNKTIDILTSENFIKNEIIDIDEKIDLSKEYKNEPKSIDEGSILFNIEPYETDTVNEYINTVDANIFDKEIKFRNRSGVKTYFDSSVLKIGSPNRFEGYLTKRTPAGQSGTGPFEVISYYGFNQTDAYKLDYVDHSYHVDITSEDYNLASVSGTHLYDFLELGNDMNDVMVMYSGKKALNQGTCLLSSVSKEMIAYAERPCFLSGWNASLSSDTAVTICGASCYILTQIPYFGIVPSLNSTADGLSYSNIDFKSISISSNIYDQYFESFMNKIYNNQKMVTCYVRLDKPDLRRIYYFDKQYWLLVEVNSYNFNDTPVKCKFTKYTP